MKCQGLRGNFTANQQTEDNALKDKLNVNLHLWERVAQAKGIKGWTVDVGVIIMCHRQLYVWDIFPQ